MAAVSSTTARSFIAGIGGLIVLGAVILLGVTASSGVPGAPVTYVRAEFDNVGASLKVGNDVRENSSRIGQISDLKYEHGHAVATLQLDGNVPVHKDATAEVWDQSALAKKFIEINRGHDASGPLGNGTIPAHRNVNSADLDHVLDVLDPPTRDALTGTLRQVGAGAGGHGPDLHDLIQHAPGILNGLGNTSGALSSPQTNLSGLLNRTNQLAGSFQGREQQLSDLVRQTGQTAGAISVDNGTPLQRSVNELPATLHQTKSSLDSLDKPLGDLHSTLSDVQPGAAALGQATPDLRGVLREGQRPLGMVPNVSAQAQPAITDLTKTVSDARPLAPAVSTGLTDAALPLNTLAPYSHQVVTFFQRIESMVSTEVAPGVHGARVGVAASTGLVDGGVVKDPLQGHDPYPAPGQADRERATSPLQGLGGGH